ncbi:MAG TPA: LamG domain-containing protein, partial [Spirochaetota bacterium]|nr:LamG domain-containing protein [Spirochaetota bacterium]
MKKKNYGLVLIIIGLLFIVKCKIESEPSSRPQWGGSSSTTADSGNTGQPSSGGDTGTASSTVNSSSAVSSTASSQTSTSGSSVWAYLPMDSLDFTLDGSQASLNAKTSTGNFTFSSGLFNNCVKGPAYATEDGLQLGAKLPANKFTIAMWVKQYNVQDQYYMIWTVLDSGSVDEHRIDFSSYGDKYRFRMYNNGTEQQIEYASLDTSQWHHIAVSVDASTATANVIMYVDGSAVINQNLDIGVPLNVSAAYSWGSRWAYKAEVYIDEAYIYRGLLTGAEVAALANTGSSSSAASASASSTASATSSAASVSSASSSSSQPASQSSTTSSVPLGKVIHYGFNNNLNDLSGNGHDGSGVSVSYTSGISNQALDCGSDTQKKYVYTEPGLTTDYIFTYAYWVKRNSTGGFEHQLARDAVYNRLRVRSAGTSDEGSGAPDD